MFFLKQCLKFSKSFEQWRARENTFFILFSIFFTTLVLLFKILFHSLHYFQTTCSARYHPPFYHFSYGLENFFFNISSLPSAAIDCLPFQYHNTAWGREEFFYPFAHLHKNNQKDVKWRKSNMFELEIKLVEILPRVWFFGYKTVKKHSRYFFFFF